MKTNRQVKQLIEIGSVVAGPLDSIDRRATSLAIELAQDYLADTFPEYQIQFKRIRRPEHSRLGRTEPSVLLQQAAEDRDARHWDFAFVITAIELIGVYSPYCFAALSRPLDAAAFSLSLIDPRAIDEDADDHVRVDRIAWRLSRLMLHALGHLMGLTHCHDSKNLLFRPATAHELDAMESFDEEQINRQRIALAEIADERLEEQPNPKASHPVFVIRAAWINRREIAEAVWGARPWEFPRRLSRLTIASVSTVVILFMTAEAWDLGLSQTLERIAALVLTSLLITTLYVIRRQQLLLRRGRIQSEQTVVTGVSAFAIVLIGMAVTWTTLALIGMVAGGLLFDAELISSWTNSSDSEARRGFLWSILQMSLFSASFGLLIGALGASFESQNYFRHVIFVDEEI